MKDAAAADSMARLVGVFRAELPGQPPLRLVAGSLARDRDHALGLITARLAQHGLAAPQTALTCESLMPCGDWAAQHAGDETGARMAAALIRPFQVSFLDYQMALPPPAHDAAAPALAPWLAEHPLTEVTPLAPGDAADFPEALSGLFDPAGGAACLALVDTASHPNLAEMIETSGLAHRSLFQGDAAEALRDAAPWLVRLDPGNGFTRNLFTHDPDTPWALWGRVAPVLIRTGDSLDAVAAHFRRLTRVRAQSDGRWLYFRFYAPQTLEQLYPVLHEDDARALLGPYALTTLSGTGARQVALAAPPRAGDNRGAAPFVLRDAYMQALEGHQKARFRDRLAQDLQASKPGLKPDEARALADTALAFCDGVGLAHKDSIAGIALVLAHLGRDALWREARLRRAADPRLSERSRKTLIHAALSKV